MSWELVLQTISGSFAAIGGWFLFDLVREFKTFKSDSKKDIESLKVERESFKNTVKNAELSIGLRVNDVQKMHSDFSIQSRERMLELKNEVDKIKLSSQAIEKKTDVLDQYLKKSFELSKVFNEKILAHQKEIDYLKIKLKDTTIFKAK